MWRTLLIAGMFLTVGAAFSPARSASVFPDSPQSLDLREQAESRPLVQEIAHRRALVIGNAGYGGAPLPGASRDALDVSTALASLGFEVTRRIDLDENDMKRALDAFSATLGPSDTALVYFAGHGMQAGGDALLLPVDVRGDQPATLVKKGLALHDIVKRLTRTRAQSEGSTYVVLDMCLDDLFNRTPPAALHLPPNTLVAFAAAPGQQALESRQNGRYTSAWLHALERAQALTPATFDAATAALANDSQSPWVVSTLPKSSAFALAIANANATDPTSKQSATATRTRGILPKDSNEQYELTFWDSIKDSTYASDYEAYLKAYPNGRFAALAKARIERLRAAGANSANKPAPAATTPPAAAKAPASTPTAPAAPVEKAEKQTSGAPASTPAPVAKPAPPPAAAAAAAAKPAAKTAGNEIKDCPSCPVLIPITPGAFTMGASNDDPAEKPPHRVTLNHAYAIGKYEVTVEQWNACADAGACTRIAPDGESSATPPANSPMRNVSWDDAQVYVKWLSKVGGKSYRLPSEAEWEYAARGGTQGTYWWGDQFKKGMGDCKDCGDPYRPEAPTPVGSYAANPYGLYDMNGSVWEWVADCWHSSYKGAPPDGRVWDDASCSTRVIRGGSWREGSGYMQSATRFKYSASVRQSQNGFRVVRDQE